MADMMAVTFSPGGTENLVPASIPKPEPGLTEVLVRVTAVGVNSIDWKTRVGEGMYRYFDDSMPMVLGWDIAGVVEERGAGVTRFNRGDRVFGMPRFPQPAHAYAQFVVARSRQLAMIPDKVSDVAAAAVPLSGLTAHQAVVDTLRVGQGERILILGAAGAVGQFAAQIARARRAVVWGAEVPERLDTLESLGINHIVDPQADDFVDSVRHMDAVLDLSDSGDRSAQVLSTMHPGSRLLTLSSPEAVPSERTLMAAGVSGSWMLVEPDHAGLEALAAMVSYGLMRVSVAETRPLERVGELHDLGESGTTIGRLVATVEH